FGPYLLLLAGQRQPSDLHAKGGVSDLVQETFLAAMQGFPEFRGTTAGEFHAWLSRILASRASNFTRHYRSRAKRASHRERSLDHLGPHGPLHAGLCGNDPTPSSLLQRREEAEVLLRALARLPEDQRRVVELHHRDGLPFQEIARRLGRSEAAVRKRWLRAIERWQREVESPHESS